MKTPTPDFIEVLESRIAPATFIVTTLKDTTDAAHDTGSLRDAMLEANNTSGSNNIVFEVMAHGKTVPLTGTIKLLSDLPQITNALAIAGPVEGKASGIVINGNNHQVISAKAGLQMTDLTISHGFTTGTGGGGVYIGTSSASALTDVTISHNRATAGSATAFGGGVYIVTGGNVTISQSKITGNLVFGAKGTDLNGARSAYGGGIFCRGTLELSHSVVSGNTAVGGSATSSSHPNGAGAYGGGIYSSQSSASVTVENSSVTGNKVIGGNGVAGANGSSGSSGQAGGNGGFVSGGGIYTWQGHTTVISSVISGNSLKGGHGGHGGAGKTGNDGGAGGKGGGCAGGGLECNASGATLTIETSTVSGNVSVAGQGGAGGAKGAHGTAGAKGAAGLSYGGGVSSTETLEISQSTISKNSAEYGGGVGIKSGTATISGSTIALNRAVDGGGVAAVKATVKIDNDTVAKNKAKLGGGLYQGQSAGVTVISSIIASNAAPTDADVTGHINASFDLIGKISAGLVLDTDTSNVKNVNPLLGALGLHGGTTATMLPSDLAAHMSPAINAGSNPDSLTADQRGDPRQLGSGVDIGAVEVA